MFGKLNSLFKKQPDTFKAKYVKPENPQLYAPIQDEYDPFVGHYPKAFLEVRPGMTFEQVVQKLQSAAPGVRHGWVFESDYLGLGYTNYDGSPYLLKSVRFCARNFREVLSIEGIELPMPIEQVKSKHPDLKVNKAKQAHDAYLARKHPDKQSSGPREPVYSKSAGSYDVELEFHKDLLEAISIFPPNSQASREAKTFAFIDELEKRDAWAAQRVDWWNLKNPDDQLKTWARWKSPDEDKSLTWFVDRLPKATPEEWHSIALEWNWDQDPMPLLWIVRQPQCDKATALTVFFLAAPEDPANDFASSKGLPRSDQIWADGYSIAVEIQRRWVDGFYTRSKIAFDKIESNYLLEYSKRDNPFIHPSMCQGLRGKIIAPPYSFFKNCPEGINDHRFLGAAFSTGIFMK